MTLQLDFLTICTTLAIRHLSPIELSEILVRRFSFHFYSMRGISSVDTEIEEVAKFLDEIGCVVGAMQLLGSCCTGHVARTKFLAANQNFGGAMAFQRISEKKNASCFCHQKGLCGRKSCFSPEI